MAAAEVTPRPSRSDERPPAGERRKGNTGPAALTLVVTVVAVVLLAVGGPVAGIAIVVLAGGAALVLQNPVVAITLPLIAAPVALREIPGAQGLQLIHVLVLVTIGSVAVAGVRGRVSAPPPVTVLAGAVLASAVLLSTLASIDPFRGLKVSLNHVLGLAVCAAAAVVARHSHSWLQQVLRYWVVASLIVIVPNLPAAAQASAVSSGALISDRAQGVFAQPNDFGEFTIFCIGMAWALLVSGRRRLDRGLGLLGLVVGTAGLAVSFSRGSWVGAGAMVLAACLLAPRLFRFVAVGVASLVAVCVAGIAMAVPPFPLLVARLSTLGGSAANPEDDRPIIHAQARRVFLENPWLGQGPGTFAQAAQDPGALLVRRPYIHAHMVPLNVAAEMGLVGLLALAAVTVAAGLSVLRALRVLGRAGAVHERTSLAVMAALLVGVAVHGLIDVVYTNPFLIPMVWMTLGLVLGASARALDTAARGHP